MTQPSRDRRHVGLRTRPSFRVLAGLLLILSVASAGLLAAQGPGTSVTAGASTPTDLPGVSSAYDPTPAAGPTPAVKAPKSTKTPYTADGYFNLAQTKKGGFTLVSPLGQPFYASGIDTVSTNGSGTDRVTGVCPYCQTVANDFSSPAAWATATVAQLRSWGFNTIDSYSDDSLLGSQMPYEVELAMASGDDWFAPSFVTNADNVAATQVAPLANNPNVIGFYTDEELDWGPLLGSGPNTYNTLLAQYLALPAGSPGLAVAQQYVGNPSGFLYALATRYFSVTTTAVRMYDTHHLILGVKAEGQEIEPSLLEAAQPYVDVFSIEDYQLWPGEAQGAEDFWHAYLPVQSNLADFEQYVKRPLMIGEYTSIAYTPATPDTEPGIYNVAPNQQTRATNYEDFVAPLYEDAPWLVGDGWFSYVDEPVNGRIPDKENDNFGMVDVNGNPYPDMVSSMELMHGVVVDEVHDSGSVCDSWANSGSGVTCTAYMPSSSSQPLTIVTTSLPSDRVGSIYYMEGVYAAGGTPGYRYSITSGSLPKGLKLKASTGMISGTPKFAGTSSFTVRATDSAGSAPVSQALSIIVTPLVKVSVQTTTLKVATQNKALSYTLAATGGTAPYTWLLTAGDLPTGLSFGSNGALTGTPTESGTFDLKFQATDSTNPVETATASLTLTVKPPRPVR